VSKSIGPILATGVVTVVNQTVFNDQPMDWRVPIATGLAALGVSFIERAWADGAVILAWSTLITVLLTRVQPNVPSPVESAVNWWSKTK
jgi:hypothetical protein